MCLREIIAQDHTKQQQAQPDHHKVRNASGAERRSSGGLYCQEELSIRARWEVAPGMMAELLHAGRFVQRGENGRVVIEVKGRSMSDLQGSAGVIPVRQGLQVQAAGRPAELHGAEAPHAHEKQRGAARSGGKLMHRPRGRGLRVGRRVVVVSGGRLFEAGG